MLDFSQVKLGKKSPKIDARTLKLARYLTPSTYPVPLPSCNWYKGVTSWGEMLNDKLGDCTCAAVGHGAQVASLNNSFMGLVTPPDSFILSLYERSCGYILDDPSSDQGGVIVDVLNYARSNPPWKKISGRKHHRHPFELLAYADPNPMDPNHIKLAIQWFGTVNIGLQLPLTALDQINKGQAWTLAGSVNQGRSQTGSWGGHSVIVAAYDLDGLTCITWGQLQKMSWEFWFAYVDEAHALLYRAWLQQFHSAFVGIWPLLQGDLALVSA